MLAKIMKWVSSITLLLMAAFSPAANGLELLFSFLVFMGAIIVFLQALGEKQYAWAGGFIGIAMAFNPAAPLFGALGSWFSMMALACAAIFAVSLLALKTRPVLSMASITDRTPGSESL